MSHVREINDPAKMAELAGPWHALLAQTPGATFFQSPDWLARYLQHFGEHQRLRLLVVERDGEVTGILPLMVRPSRRRLGQVRVLTYPLDDWGSYYGPIGPDPAQTLSLGLQHVLRSPRDWHVLELPWVDALGVHGGATDEALAAVGWSPQVEPWQTSALVDLNGAGSWENYWASRQSRWRNNVRRSERKLAHYGKITHLRYRPPAGGDPRWDLYNHCETIARSSWQANSTTGTTLVHERVRGFLRDCHRAAAAAGAVDLNLLLVSGRPVAFNYAYHYRGSVFGLRTGFDPATASDGAGTVLQARMIADSFQRGDHLYDLGAGYLECKRYWLTEARPSFRYTCFPPGEPVAKLIQAKRAVERWWRGDASQAAHK